MKVVKVDFCSRHYRFPFDEHRRNRTMQLTRHPEAAQGNNVSARIVPQARQKREQ
jgi:hypothetical protein